MKKKLMIMHIDCGDKEMKEFSELLSIFLEKNDAECFITNKNIDLISIDQLREVVDYNRGLRY